MTSLLGPKHPKAFRNNYLAAMGVLVFLLISAVSTAQVIPPPSTNYANRVNRLVPDSTLYIPTACGAPVDSTQLFSKGFGNGGKAALGAHYYDSCGHHLYVWDPALKNWHRVDSSSGRSFDSTTSQGGVFHTGTYNDTRFLKRVDSATSYVTPKRLADSATALRGLISSGFDSASSQGGGFHTQPYNDTRYLKKADSATAYSTVKRVADTAAALRAAIAPLVGVDTTIFRASGTAPTLKPSFYLSQVGGINTITIPQTRDSLDFHSDLSTDSARRSWVQAHDTTSANALQSKAQTDSMRANLYASIAGKMANLGGAPGQLQGTFAALPAATSYATGTTYIAQDSGFQYVDTGSGGSRGWKKIAGSSNGGGSPAAGVSGSVQIKSASTGLLGNVPNFTGDSVTHIVNADSLQAHMARMDSFKVTPTRFFNYPYRSEGYGHSMLNGLNAPVKYNYFDVEQIFPDSSWRNRLATWMDIPDFNHGYTGSGSVDDAMIGTKYQTNNSRAITFILDAWNNINSVTPTVPNTYNKIVNANKYLAINAFLKRYKAPNSTDSVTLYGTWSAYTVTATSALPPGLSNVPLSETKTGTNARQTTTINDSAVWTSPIDSTVVIELLGWKLSGSTVQVFIDNVSKGTITTNFQNDSSNTDIFIPPGRGQYPLLFTGLSNASHKVKIVNTTAGKLVIDFFGNLKDARYCYPVVILHDPDHGGTKPNVTLSNSKQDSLASAFPAPYPIYTFATNTYINPATDISSDSVHPNGTGHYHMDSGLHIFVNAHLPTGETGKMMFSNGLYEKLNNDLRDFKRFVTSNDLKSNILPITFPGNQTVYMNGYTVNFYDSGSHHYVYMPDANISDSSGDTYLTFNAFRKNSSNTGIRVTSSSSGNQNPSYMYVGGNDPNFGSALSAGTGAISIYDFRAVTAPYSIAVKASGTGTDIIPFAIHETGGIDIGGRDNSDSADTWMYFKPGTASRMQLKFGPSPARPLTTNAVGRLTYTSVGGLDSLNFDHNGVRTNLLAAGGTSYQTVQSNTSSQTQRAKLNFGPEFTTTDNSGNGSTDITSPMPYVMTTDASAITNTTTPGSLKGTGFGSLTFPANYFIVGKTITLKLRGLLSTDVTNTGVLGFNFSTSNGSYAFSSVPDASLSNQDWDMEVICVCRAIGASGTGSINVSIKWSIGSKIYYATETAVNFATTSTQTFDLTSNWAQAISGNSIQCKMFNFNTK